jgi:uncharacterized repeat protein (TIGR01451 family)
MKQTYLFCLLFVSLFSSAQIINFPNANFKARLVAASNVNWIASSNPTTFDGSQWVANSSNKIDTNNDGEIQVTEAQAVKCLSLFSQSINNLSGIEYFTNLEFLAIQGNTLTNLNLSSNIKLKYLGCMNNPLTVLDLSNCIDLRELKCNNTTISVLNVGHCTLLKKILCYSSFMTSLNLANCVSLEHLECNNNQLSNLNFTNCIALKTLHCYTNNITNLNFSNCPLLNLAWCHDNDLTSLLVTNCTLLNTFNCYSNNLTNLDVSDCINLVHLQCQINSLTSLDVSNNSLLKTLRCYGTQITTLDVSNCPYLDYFDCYNNINLTYLNIKNGNFNNYIGGITPNTSLKYICADDEHVASIQNSLTSNNVASNCHVNSYCSFTPNGIFYEIKGKTVLDINNNGCDLNDIPFKNLTVGINNGTATSYLINDNSGNYYIPVGNGNYTLTPILENPNYFNISPTNYIVNFPIQSSPFTQDFCSTPNGIHNDVEVSIIPTSVARPGFDAKYKIIYKNKGNQVENGTINLEFDDAILDLVSTNPAFTTQTTNNLSFNYTNLNPFETREINVVINVNSPMETPAVNSGDILNYTVTNTITNTDEMLSDNTFVLNQTVVNSYDPNDKKCLQGNTIAPSEVGKYVHYMIRFENTGTFPAENIVVKDMIDTAKFDVSSLVPLHASHNYFTRISVNKVEFIFENINLPFDDANNDGYIAFKIKILPSLVLGNTFSNSANIYFDYNFPIVTNTATTTIAALSNPSFEFGNYFSLYPNPTTNELNINLKSAIEINSIQIYNTIGQLVTVQTGNALKVDVSNLKTGNYFIKINTNEGFSTSQFIKE